MTPEQLKTRQKEIKKIYKVRFFHAINKISYMTKYKQEEKLYR